MDPFWVNGLVAEIKVEGVAVVGKTVHGKAIPDALVPAATGSILQSALAHRDLFISGKVFGRDPGLPPNVPRPLEG